MWEKINKKTVCFLLTLLMLFGCVETNFAGAAQASDFNYYIEINDEYTVTEGTYPYRTYSGSIYGWGITGAAVSSCTITTTDGDGMKPDRTYDIALASDTEGDAEFFLFCDYDDGENYVCPMVNTLPGLQEIAKLDNFDYMIWDLECKIPIQLDGGRAQYKVYITSLYEDLMSTVHTFNFTIAPPDTTNDPAPEDVASIAITTPPTKMTYFTGQTFDRAGMVVTATLIDDGGTVPVTGYEITPDGPLTELGENTVTVSFGGHTATQAIEVQPSTNIDDVRITNGQFLLDYEWDPDNRVLKKQKNTFNAAVLYGETMGVFTFHVREGAEVYIGQDEQEVSPDGLCTLSLPTSTAGESIAVTLKGGTSQTDYTFNCYSQIVSGMPTAVVDYLCIASQYTNGNGLGPYGVNAVATLRGGGTSVSGDTKVGPTSLGNFGGYITYYYENAVYDDPRNPYGADFLVSGNSVENSNAFAEPGNVLVSEDGLNWYTLAGSLHYDDNAIWDYEITYRSAGGRAAWTDNLGNSGTSYWYPQKTYYPLFPWPEGTEQQITISGVLLTPAEGTNEYGNTQPPLPHFGYVDVGEYFEMGKSGLSGTSNPYKGTRYSESSRRTHLDGVDSFDLKWAVDADGLPKTFENGIHYVKVQAANNIDNGGIGEKSTEVNMMRVAQPASSSVGRTDAPTSITMDRKTVTVPGANLGVINNVEVSGAFVVNVGTDAENVYINGSRGVSSTFSTIPDHGMLRIIVQEGEKEPWIGYFNLVEGEPDENDVYTTVTFDPIGGNIDGKNVRTYMPEMPDADKTFPTPVWKDRTFLGWYDSTGTKYTGYTENLPRALTLKAQWQYNLKPEEPKTLDATFRLVGSTRSDEDVDLGEGDEGYHGAKYVTWIATRQYTMNKGDTMYELFVSAFADAGLRAVGQDANYVKTIYAPDVCGGYKLSEFTNGQYSGWMYTVNGNHPALGLLEYDLKNGDKVIWHYVNDYRYEVHDWAELGGGDFPPLGDGKYWNEWLKAKDVDPDESNASAAPSDSTILAPKVTASNGVASVTVKASDMTNAITKAKENDSKAIVIAPEITGTAKKVSVELPKASLSSVASGTDADLTVKTPVGNITIPNDVLASVASQASGSNIAISLESVNKETALTAEQKEAAGADPVYDISILSGGKNISSFNGGSITVSLPYTLKDGEAPSGVTVWYLNDKGELEKMTCTYNKTTGLATFTTDHLSYYVVGWSEVWQNAFTDVKDTDWFYSAVEFAVKNGLFNGVTDTTFSPNAQMTRAMLVTVLYRLDRATKTVTVSTAATSGPAVTGGALTAEKSETQNFADVKGGKWYTDAIAWANANGIVTGMGGGLFGTDNNVTREQMATVLYNYAKYKGYDVTKVADLNAYTDAAAVKSWAQTAMKWTNAEGLITGRTATTLVSGGSTSRAEVATILKRLTENIEE
ncbi:MAG TPA: S-layer homology domain-containing protein [Anaerovoracaceae bacterium]|nr:S-layer homology domain-containing protein [Anaerovoracaceae bacterium]